MIRLSLPDETPEVRKWLDKVESKVNKAVVENDILYTEQELCGFATLGCIVKEIKCAD